MNQFVLKQGTSGELQMFPHVMELGIKKNSSVQLNSMSESSMDSIRIYYVIEGKFEWSINQRQYMFYPGDVALVLPGHTFGSEKGFLEIGTLGWINIKIHKLESGETIPGKWSSLSESESLAIGKILLLSSSPVLSKFNEVGRILQYLQNELFKQEIGYCTRVNQLLDELFITITRQLTRQDNSGRDFPKAFMQLEQKLRKDLSHQWTVEEMAAVIGIGTTLFNEKVKNYSGFSPINYLINIRISESIKLLRNQDVSVTDVALDMGFYSSQHFSTTFKKLTGYTPSDLRKKNISNE